MTAALRVVLMIALTIVISLSLPAQAAGPIVKVADINRDRSQSSTGASFFLGLGGFTYFAARDFGSATDEKRQLWKTDGTLAGTTFVRLLPPGGSVRKAVKSGNLLYYIVSESLVRSDGTAAGTWLLQDLVTDMADVNGTLFYAVRGNNSGLYKTSGTQSSIQKLKSFTGPPLELVAVGSLLYLAGVDAAHGIELWKSDGTEAGTVLVRDILAGPSSGNPSGLTASGNRVYFVRGSELWTSDGTEVGTVRLHDLVNDGFDTLADLNGTVVAFTSAKSIYRSDGTGPGTAFADSGPFGLYLARSTEVGRNNSFAVHGSHLYFMAGDPAGSSHSFLWRIGQSGKAVIVSGPDVNSVSSGVSVFGPVVTVGDDIFFTDATGNGAPRGLAYFNPVTVKNAMRSAYGTEPSALANVNGDLYFSQLDVDPLSGDKSDSPFRANSSGVTLLKNINATTSGTGFSANFTAVAGGKLFLANLGTPNQLITVTSSGTDYVPNPSNPSFQYSGIAPFGSGILYGIYKDINVGGGLEQGVYAFTPGAGSELVDVWDDPDKLQFFTVGGLSSYYTVNGNGLQVTDGTKAGTRSVGAGFNQGFTVREIVRSNGITFLVVQPPSSGPQLWRTTGSDTGLEMLASGLRSTGAGPFLLPYSGGVYFTGVAVDANNSNSIYKSDGTVAGTLALASAVGFPIGAELLGMAGDKLYYNGATGNNPFRVYAFDGSTSVQIHSLRADPFGRFAAVEGSAYFIAHPDFVTNTDTLFKSSGVAGGTVPVLDLAGRIPRRMTSFGGMLFFILSNELWRSNGTPAGTFLVQKLNPNGNSMGDILGVTNNLMYLAATGPLESSGTEIYMLDVGSTTVQPPTVTASSRIGQLGQPLNIQVAYTGADVVLRSLEYRSSGVTTGFLPGVTFNPATGIISGTPVQSGAFAFDILAQNPGGTASAFITIKILGPNDKIADIDGNNTADAPTDGLLTIRYLFGLRGPSLTNGTVASDATRSAADIEEFLGQVLGQVDIDGNGTSDALTDGLLMMRYMSGLRGNALIANAVGSGATRKTAADIEAYLQTLVP